MLDCKRVVGAVVATTAFFYTLCALLTILFPAQTLLFFNNWFHTVDLFKIYPEGKLLVTPTNFLVGLFGSSFTMGVASCFFIWVYKGLRNK